MESYTFGNIEDAIQRLQEIKKEGRNDRVIIFTIDFDNNTESKKVMTSDEGCVLVRKSKTIIINEDTLIPHIQLFSTPQTNIENLIKKGIMHDIIFGTG